MVVRKKYPLITLAKEADDKLTLILQLFSSPISDQQVIKEELERHIEEISAYYYAHNDILDLNLRDQGQQYYLPFKKKLIDLQEFIYKDYKENANTVLIDLLTKTKLSPFSFTFCLDDKKHEKNEILEQKALYIQNYWHNYRRAKLHCDVFSALPTTLVPSSLKLIRNKVQRIIFDLTQNQAVVSHQIYHWTTLQNFRNILRNKYFLGAEALKFRGIFYEKNALTAADVANGDGNVICFCPNLVDPTALIREGTLRKDLIRLTINLNKIDSQYRYHQFFKIVDMLTIDFTYRVKLTEELTVIFEKKRNCFKPPVVLRVTLQFKETETNIFLHNHEIIFYGNIFSINRFCLSQLFKMVDSIPDLHFKEEIYSYIDKLNVKECTELLVNFSKSLTIFSEYNFNRSLKLTDHLISEIYFQNNFTVLSLQHLSPKIYCETLLKVFEDQIQKETEAVEPFVLIDSLAKGFLSQNGHLMDASMRKMNTAIDFTLTAKEKEPKLTLG